MDILKIFLLSNDWIAIVDLPPDIQLAPLNGFYTGTITLKHTPFPFSRLLALI